MTVVAEYLATNLTSEQLGTLERVLGRLKQKLPADSRIDFAALVENVQTQPEDILLKRFDRERKDRIAAKAYELSLDNPDYDTEICARHAESEIEAEEADAILNRMPRVRIRRQRRTS